MSSAEKPSLPAMRHTAAHVLAAASRVLNPDTKLGVGPAIENGFYHDIDVAEHYTDKDLLKLQKEMEKIKKRNFKITQRDVSKAEARELFKDDEYKLELIDEIEGDVVGISDMGDGFFVTLCRGGHVESTRKIGFFKLTSLAGAYWKGDEKRKQLQRVYGALFETKEELETYLLQQEEAKKRDHRKLGKELDLFTFSPLVGSGLPMFTPRGYIIRRELERFLQSIQEPLGYTPVWIPHLAKPELYKTSGHWDKFKADLFHVKGHGEEEFVVKPINCPHHTQIYASRPRSYRDLPLRFCECTTVYRDEQPGELQGLSRVRSITQDDAHVFCRMDQVEAEIKLVMQIIDLFYAAFDFELKPRLSLRDPNQPEKYLGSPEAWDQSEAILRGLLKERGQAFFEGVGEAAFYGPKIDFVGRDSLGREWQLATAQLDFNQPARFELTYNDSDGSAKTPVMIHRAILGSFERFIAVLIEHYAGALPLWLSPVQVAVLPLTDVQHDYGRTVADELKKAGFRVELDDRSESVGKKIREAQLQKVPLMLIVGPKEVEEKTVAMRWRETGDAGTQSVAQLITTLQEKISASKTLVQ
jgi:threonyl-tRNA synthetase